MIVPLRRCVGKPTPAAPEVQLRDVVWNPFSVCTSRPTIRTRESVVVVIITQFAQSDNLVQLPCREFHCSEFFFNAFLVVPVDPQESFSSWLSQGFGCRAALQRSMRLTTTTHYAWVRRRKACVAAKGGFFLVAQREMADRIVPLKDTTHLSRHFTLHGRWHHRHRQHLPCQHCLQLILKWAPGPILFELLPKHPNG